MPFWFLNDDLDAGEIRRQIADFEAHGVGGVVLHPRVGLPRSQGWMSDALLGFLGVAIEACAERGMSVILYDEGMYPSGSSCGQVVARSAAFACRGVDHRVLEAGEEPVLPEGANLVAVVPRGDGRRIAVFDRRIEAGIRGLHFADHDAPRGPVPFGEPGFRDPPEDAPPAGDLLNPDAVAAFIELVYDRYYECFAPHFGSTILAIFTDEPDVLGRCSERSRVRPGTAGILEHVNRILGYDFTPHLPALWYDDEPDAVRHRRAWDRAIRARLEETYYAPLQAWCEAHHVALTGHPADPDDLGMERYFHIPGQDIVWRHIEPGKPSALLGPPSTMAKCASSAAVHLGRRRNANELFGAYGHNLTFDEMKWLTDWCLVRGQNLLIPHAFYYSTRGPRIDERPPDVGPNSPWWGRYRDYADYVARLCYLNAEGRLACEIAVLAGASHLPDELVRPLYEHQFDFNYLEDRHLLDDAAVDRGGIHIRGMHYKLLLIDESLQLSDSLRQILQPLVEGDRVIRWSSGGRIPDSCLTPAQLITAITRELRPTINVAPSQPDLRARRVTCDGAVWVFLTNESLEPLRFRITDPLPGSASLIDPYRRTAQPYEGEATIELPSYETLLLHVPGDAGG